jgi:hypothetical protein
MSFFRALQDSAFTDWFLGSDSIWAYPTVLTLHTVGMAMLVGASLVVHLRVWQVGAAIPVTQFRPLYRIIWAGFAINLLSGLVLFVTEAADRVVDPVFYIKLGAIFAALWLGVVVKRRVIDTDLPTQPSSTAPVRSLSAASLALWTTAIVAGRLMAYLTKK